MKTTVFLLLSPMLFFYFDIVMADLPVTIDCSRYPTKMCSLEYIPHCGVIRDTYSNKCDFCNAFVKSGRSLQLEYTGVCSKDRKDTAVKELPIDCSGYPKEACSKEYEPLCGSTRHTYANKCAFCNAFVKNSRKLQLDYVGRCS